MTVCFELEFFQENFKFDKDWNKAKHFQFIYYSIFFKKKFWLGIEMPV